MSYRYLAKLARLPLPSFVVRRADVRRVRQLAATGHLEAHFYPPVDSDDQFGEVRALTPAGRRLLRELASTNCKADAP